MFVCGQHAFTVIKTSVTSLCTYQEKCETPGNLNSLSRCSPIPLPTIMEKKIPVFYWKIISKVDMKIDLLMQ